MNKIVIIGLPQEDAPCEYCGQMAELRPYGKNGAKICFDCGMKPENKSVTEKAFDDVLAGKSEMPKKEQSN